MTIIVVCTVGGVFLLWAVWWIYRGNPKHGKHRTTVAPTVAAHHPLPRPSWLADLGSQPLSRDDVSATKARISESRHRGGYISPKTPVSSLPKVPAGPAPGASAHHPLPVRHTHRDPTIGRYTRKEQ